MILLFWALLSWFTFCCSDNRNPLLNEAEREIKSAASSSHLLPYLPPSLSPLLPSLSSVGGSNNRRIWSRILMTAAQAPPRHRAAVWGGHWVLPSCLGAAGIEDWFRSGGKTFQRCMRAHTHTRMNTAEMYSPPVRGHTHVHTPQLYAWPLRGHTQTVTHTTDVYITSQRSLSHTSGVNSWCCSSVAIFPPSGTHVSPLFHLPRIDVY